VEFCPDFMSAVPFGAKENPPVTTIGGFVTVSHG
jgi:hypothetical protein